MVAAGAVRAYVLLGRCRVTLYLCRCGDWLREDDALARVEWVEGRSAAGVVALGCFGGGGLHVG